MSEHIEEMRTSISQMSTEEIRERLSEVRNLRRSGGKKPGKDASTKLLDKIGKMSKEDRDALLADLLKEGEE